MSEYLISYDICCPRRLARVHKVLRQHALAMQYSVFWFQGSPRQLAGCLDELERLMDPRYDDIRAYPLPQRGLRLWHGAPLLAEGVHWSGLPDAWQRHAG